MVSTVQQDGPMVQMIFVCACANGFVLLRIVSRVMLAPRSSGPDTTLVWYETGLEDDDDDAADMVVVGR